MQQIDQKLTQAEEVDAEMNQILETTQQYEQKLQLLKQKELRDRNESKFKEKKLLQMRREADVHNISNIKVDNYTED